jgi:uncharacterized membrane protein YedE/YeeE
MFEILKNPWPWYVSGPLIGLAIPVLLLIGNKTFGISSSLRHICAACLPSDISYFRYNWKKESWNLMFVLGILIGGFLATFFLNNHQALDINPATVSDLKELGVTDFSNLMPLDLFGTDQIFSLKGFVFLVLGGFLVGFGTRYAGGCTSGHSIMGLANLQWPSLVATICFMVGGFLSTHLLLPFLFHYIF